MPARRLGAHKPRETGGGCCSSRLQMLPPNIWLQFDPFGRKLTRGSEKKGLAHPRAWKPALREDEQTEAALGPVSVRLGLGAAEYAATTRFLLASPEATPPTTRSPRACGDNSLCIEEPLSHSVTGRSALCTGRSDVCQRAYVPVAVLVILRHGW